MSAENSIRLFAAIPVGEKNKQIVSSIVKSNPISNGIKWTHSDDLHITLFFIGNTSKANLERIKFEIEKIALQQRSFILSFEKYELKGKKERPSMFWGTFKKSESFSNLNVELRARLAFSITQEEHHKDPIPHCTIARLKSALVKSELITYATAMQEISVDRIELWESKNGRYSSIAAFFFPK
jgi:2'-5' RNA ligase